MAALRRSWRVYARRGSRYQAELLLSLIYLLALGPTAILGRLLRKKWFDDEGPMWHPRDPGPRTLEAHERMF